MQEDEFDAFCQDLRVNGQFEPIRTLGDGGPVVEGRNRHLACMAEDMTPIFEPVPDGSNGPRDDADLATYVWSLNFERRHLSPSQAGIAQAQMRRYMTELGTQDGVQSVDKIASRRTEKRGARLLRSGAQPLIEAVHAGEITLLDAERVLGLEKRDQVAMLKEVQRGKAQTLAEAIKRRERDAMDTSEGKESAWLADMQEPYLESLRDVKAITARMKQVADDPRIAVHLPWNRMRVDLNSLKSALTANSPNEVCCGPDGPPDCQLCKGAGFLTEFVSEGLTKQQRQEFEAHRAENQF